jgi:hypothetical protein
MGSTKFEGGLLQKCLQVKDQKLPQTKDYNYLQKNYNCYNVYTIHKDTKRYTKIQQDVSEINTLAKHAPIALTLLDRLHWQP